MAVYPNGYHDMDIGLDDNPEADPFAMGRVLNIAAPVEAASADELLPVLSSVD